MTDSNNLKNIKHKTILVLKTGPLIGNVWKKKNPKRNQNSILRAWLEFFIQPQVLPVIKQHIDWHIVSV